MKKQWALLVLLLAFSPNIFAHNAPSRGTNPLLRFVAEVRILREIALYTLLEDRCARYLNNAEEESCFEAVDQKITLLDFDILLGKDKKTPVLLDKSNPGSFVFVAFKKDLLKLLSDQKTENYLRLINEEMSKFLTGQKRNTPNLWDLSLAFYGNEFEAARSLAVLFQDTSPVKLHLAFFEVSGQRSESAYFDSNREILSRTIDTINMVLNANGENFQALFYPKSAQSKLHGNIYHFYVPTYLSMALKKRGVPARFAFIAPLMMTLTYEFVTAGEDYRYLFADPETVSEWSMGDIFTGYNGASFGTTRAALTFDEVKNAFSISTAKGVATLLK
jgi:hypothetical protein